MLSSLQIGGLVHVIDKTKGVSYKVGEVVSKTEPMNDFNMNSSYIDMTVRIDNENYDFKHIPSSSSMIYYNNSSIILSETKEALIPSVETILHNSRQIVDEKNIEYHKGCIEDCEDVLKKLNPAFAKEKERDSRIDSLECQMKGMDDKLDKIFNLIKTK